MFLATASPEQNQAEPVAIEKLAEKQLFIIRNVIEPKNLSPINISFTNS
jgi:hypothetical protein